MSADSRPLGALPASLAELHPDPWTEPFWRATAEHRLVCARCTSCGTFRMPPAPFCHVCRAQEVAWPELPGTGVVYTFTVVRHAVATVALGHLPYVVAVVELDGAPGARLIANILGADPSVVEIGRRVHVRWDDVGPRTTIPRFELVDS
jgi:uncharacterized OB-fold protein